MRGVIDSIAIAFLVCSWWIAIARYRSLPDEVAFGQIDFLSGRDICYGRYAIFFPGVLQFVFLGVGWLITSGAALQPPLVHHIVFLEVQAFLCWMCWRLTEIGLGRATGLGFWPILIAFAVFSTTLGLLLPPAP